MAVLDSAGRRYDPAREPSGALPRRAPCSVLFGWLPTSVKTRTYCGAGAAEEHPQSRTGPSETQDRDPSSSVESAGGLNAALLPEARSLIPTRIARARQMRSASPSRHASGARSSPLSSAPTPYDVTTCDSLRRETRESRTQQPQIPLQRGLR